MITAVRRPTAPESLKNQKNYAEQDVRAALYADFHGKCYLCERHIENGSFEVDHREPQNENPSRIYDWTNLYPACNDCNGRRWKKGRPGGWLHPEDNAEGRLIQQIARSLPGELFFAATDFTDLQAKNAALELEHLHCEQDPKACDIRNALFRQLDAIAQEIEAYLLESDQNQRHLQEAKLRRLFSRSAPYTALIRYRFARFQQLFDSP
jgi:hypothetical protein